MEHKTSGGRAATRQTGRCDAGCCVSGRRFTVSHALRQHDLLIAYRPDRSTVHFFNMRTMAPATLSYTIGIRLCRFVTKSRVNTLFDRGSLLRRL